MDRPLRFCMITTFYPPYNFGGDGVFVRQLSNELAERGHRVEVIHCIDSYRMLAKGEPPGSYNDHPNVRVHGLESKFGFLSPLATQQTGFPLFKSAQIKRILEKGFDVIHFHNVSLVGGPKILEYGEGIKLYTMHEYWLVCPTHVLFRFNRAPCTEPHCLPCTLTYKRPPQLWRYSGLLEAAVKHVDVFIAPSQFIKDIHRQRGLDIPIVRLPNFVPCMDTALPTAEETNSVSEQPFFLFVGRLEKLKGLQTVIPVFQRYRKAMLLVAGKGDYESELRRLAGGDTNIRFLGHLSQARLQSLYRQAAAVVVPSICFEIAPLVAFEAFRQKTPVVIRNIGGMPEIIEESGGGFAYDTEEELIASMDLLLAKPSYRDEPGTRGYEAYKLNWTPEAHLKRYFDLIHEIAATRE